MQGRLMNTKKLFLTATILILITAGLHTMGHFSPPPEDASLADLQQHMEQTRLSLPMSMEPSMMDVLKSLSLTMTILLLALTCSNILVLRLAAGNARLLTAFVHLNQVIVIALVGLYSTYEVFPPLVCFAVVGFVLLMAQWSIFRQKR